MDDDNRERLSAVREIRVSLEQNPVFHLSLNSKELFHSNLLAWLFEHITPLGRHLLEALEVRDGDDELDVRREHRHLDLTVKLPGLGPVVIENKVFDLPDEAQLLRYAAAVDDPGTDLVLFSLSDPTWPDNVYVTRHGTWRFVSYRQLADALEETLAQHGSGGFDVELLHRYCSMVRDLDAMADVTALKSEFEPIAVSEEIREELRAARLLAPIGKRRAREAVRFIARAHAIPSLHPDWNAGFTRDSPLVEVFFDHGGDGIGWQYQDDQWRIAVRTADHHGNTARSERERYVNGRYPGLFNFDATEQFATDAAVPAKEIDGGYYGFNPNFVYRYRTVPRLSAQQLSDLSNHSLDHLARVVPQR